MSSSALRVVATDAAPKAIGPYSQAIVANGFVFCSGQIPFIPESGELLKGDISAQARQSLQNMAQVLKAANSSVDRVVKTTVFLKDMNDFQAMNAVYSDFFGQHKPARSAVEVARLPRDVLFEIECVAVVSQ